MKVLVVEDDDFKRELIEDFLSERNIDIHMEYSVKPALRYVIQNPKEISGIILDMGLTSSDDSWDYDWMRGLDLVVRLNFDKINIPILINSSTDVQIDKLKEDYKSLHSQMYREDDYETLEKFITFLETGGW
ncbi:MAG: hypothetical protein ACI4UU_01165 [Clostridia bacterium]